jgi:hypothetical protein
MTLKHVWFFAHKYLLRGNFLLLARALCIHLILASHYAAQPLTEMSTSNISWSVNATGA